MQTRGFNIILCESDWTFMWHVNQYVHRKKSNMFPDAARFPDAWLILVVSDLRLRAHTPSRTVRGDASIPMCVWCIVFINLDSYCDV